MIIHLIGSYEILTHNARRVIEFEGAAKIIKRVLIIALLLRVNMNIILGVFKDALANDNSISAIAI